MLKFFSFTVASHQHMSEKSVYIKITEHVVSVLYRAVIEIDMKYIIVRVH